MHLNDTLPEEKISGGPLNNHYELAEMSQTNTVLSSSNKNMVI